MVDDQMLVLALISIGAIAIESIAMANLLLLFNLLERQYFNRRLIIRRGASLLFSFLYVFSSLINFGRQLVFECL